MVMDPAALGFVLPPEWVLHARTWMSWIPDGYLRERGGAQQAWGSVASAIAQFEPVTVLAPFVYVDEARAACGPRVHIVGCALNDGWFRDNGPTFLLDGFGRLGAALWAFNAWGGRFPGAEVDRAAGRFAADRAGALAFCSALVNEGGAIATDGAGTVIVTETVQANPNRNPGWETAAIEHELRRMLGVSTVIWLAAGLHGDTGPFGTDGHVDTLAAFVAPGTVVVHHQPDPDHADYAVTADNAQRLRSARDHAGRRLQLIELPAPPAGRVGHVDHESYVNFAWVNGGVVLGGFGHEASDTIVRETFRRLFPRRRVVQLDASVMFTVGGGIHCITQPEPVRQARWPARPPN